MVQRARGFEVREAVAGDAAAIAHVQTTTWRAAYADLVPADHLAAMGGEARVERWRRNLREQGDRIRSFVAVRDGAVVGFSGAGPARGDDAPEDFELYALYTLPDEQRRGVGRALLAACARFVVLRGGSSMFAWALRDGPGQHFYRAVGAEPRGSSEYEVGGAKLPEDGWIFSPVADWLDDEDRAVVRPARERLPELLKRAAFFSEAHSVKAALAWARLRLRFPAVRAALGEDAFAWNQVLSTPAVDGLLSARVAWDMAEVADRRLKACVDGAVFPLAYAAAVEQVRREGARALVERYRERALARLGAMGHAYTIHRSFEEALPYLVGDEAHGLLAERTAELVATQLATVEHARDPEPASPVREEREVVDQVLRSPGYFGHTVITLGTFLRLRDRLGADERARVFGAIAAMLASYGDLDREVEVPAPAGGDAGEDALARAVVTLVTRGPEEAHTLTLADGACGVFDYATPAQRAHVVAVLEAFAAWSPRRAATGERATDAE